MPATVLPIYALHRPLPRLNVVARAVAGLIAAMSLAVLIIAARLTPSATGMETHLQLGLAPCALYRNYGIPCFACGMTTSFAHLAHGQVLQSILTQPAGAIFAFVTAMSVWVGAYIALTGRPSEKLLNSVPTLPIFFGCIGVGLIAWAYKIVIVLHAAH